MTLRYPGPRLALALVLLCIGPVVVPTVLAQTTAPGPLPSVRIVAPRQGEKLSANFVTVRFELLDPAATANSSPNFQVRLDGRDPVRTTDVEFTFSGLTAGTHTILVELVDANGTPINGTRTQVRFHVAPPQPLPTDAVPDHSDLVRQTRSFGGARLVPAVFTWVERDEPAPPAEPQPVAAPQSATRQLPQNSSALPLLSVIGFGALVGGLASALRTR
jgi:hypothetical protein